MKRKKRREYQKLAKKKRKKNEKNKKNKVAHVQSAKPREQGHVPNYRPAMDYMSGYCENINSFSNEISNLSSVAYQPSIVNSFSAIQDSLSSFNSFESILPNLDHHVIVSPALDNSRYATLAYTGLSNLPLVNELASIVTPDIPDWYKQTIIKSSLPTASVLSDLEITMASNSVSEILGANNLSAFSVQSSLSMATEYSLYTEKSLSSFPWVDIGQRIGLSDVSKGLISESFLGMSTGYSDLTKSFEINPVSYVELSPALVKHAPVEYYTSANLLEVISTDQDITTEEDSLNNEIQYENEYSLNTYLPRVHSGLLTMWQGAIETVNSNNSDKVRQVSTSLRELFTHVMHKLAPDDEVKIWTTDESFYHDGKPTRKARLHYICRNISNEPFNVFVEKDIQSTLELINVFQGGTHSIESGITPQQLIAIKSKAESALKFLLEIEFKANR